MGRHVAPIAHVVTRLSNAQAALARFPRGTHSPGSAKHAEQFFAAVQPRIITKEMAPDRKVLAQSCALMKSQDLSPELEQYAPWTGFGRESKLRAMHRRINESLPRACGATASDRGMRLPGNGPASYAVPDYVVSVRVGWSPLPQRAFPVVVLLTELKRAEAAMQRREAVHAQSLSYIMAALRWNLAQACGAAARESAATAARCSDVLRSALPRQFMYELVFGLQSQLFVVDTAHLLDCARAAGFQGPVPLTVHQVRLPLLLGHLDSFNLESVHGRAMAFALKSTYLRSLRAPALENPPQPSI